jgi:hypothetical protein
MTDLVDEYLLVFRKGDRLDDGANASDEQLALTLFARIEHRNALQPMAVDVVS